MRPGDPLFPSTVGGSNIGAHRPQTPGSRARRHESTQRQNHSSTAIAERSGEASTGQVWLLVTRRALWHEFRVQSAWQFHDHSRGQAQRIRNGDIGIVYLTKETESSKSLLVAKIALSELDPVPADDSQFRSFYRHRLPFKLVMEAIPPRVFSDLVPSLTFITRKERYGVFLQGRSAILLSKSDGEVVLAALASGRGRSILPSRERQSRSPT